MILDADVQDVITFALREKIIIKICYHAVNLGKNILVEIQKFATDFRGANQRVQSKTLIVVGNLVIKGGRNIVD
jgi:putative cardiolipin synthase